MYRCKCGMALLASWLTDGEEAPHQLVALAAPLTPRRGPSEEEPAVAAGGSGAPIAMVDAA